MKPMITKTILERLQKEYETLVLSNNLISMSTTHSGTVWQLFMFTEAKFQSYGQQGSITLEKAPLQ